MENKERKTRSPASIYRDKRKVMGFKRVEAMIGPKAVAALEKLASTAGLKARVISNALIEAGKKAN
jgi:hypothetical protein